jgi:hypothetical protein
VAGCRLFGKTLKLNFMNFVLTHNNEAVYSNSINFLKILKDLVMKTYVQFPFYVYRRTRESAEEDVRELDQFLSIQGKNLTEVTLLLKCKV